MKLDGIHWLEQQEPGFGNLQDAEKSEILDFCMLWSYFEGHFLNEAATDNSIRRFVTKFERDDGFDNLKLDEFVEYFRNRYVLDGNFTDSYQGLHLERSPNFPEVNQMLLELNSTAIQMLTGCLLIIYRFRNNLFHGGKWQYNFHRQLNNFTCANRLLMKLIELSHPVN